MAAPDRTHPDHRRRGGVRQTVRSVARAVGVAVVALIVVTELRKPPGERTWHGRVLGWLPYDLRVPTVERVRRSLWSPEDPRLILPRAFGVGWSPNLGRLAKTLRGH